MAKSLLLIPEILIHIFNQANRFRYSIYIIKPQNNYFKKINYKEMHFQITIEIVIKALIVKSNRLVSLVVLLIKRRIEFEVIASTGEFRMNYSEAKINPMQLPQPRKQGMYTEYCMYQQFLG